MTKLRQVRIEGTYDPLHPAVQERAEKWLDYRRCLKLTKNDEKEALDELIASMQDYDVSEVELEGYRIVLEIVEKPKVSVVEIPDNSDLVEDRDDE